MADHLWHRFAPSPRLGRATRAVHGGALVLVALYLGAAIGPLVQGEVGVDPPRLSPAAIRAMEAAAGWLEPALHVGCLALLLAHRCHLRRSPPRTASAVSSAAGAGGTPA